MTELGEYFSGTKALTRVKKNETLEKWYVYLFLLFVCCLRVCLFVSVISVCFVGLLFCFVCVRIGQYFSE
jgi:hypothetical protein